MSSRRDVLARASILASLAVAATLLVVHEGITRRAFDASVAAAELIEEALPDISRLTEQRGHLRQVREAGLSILDDPSPRARRRLLAALGRVRAPDLQEGDAGFSEAVEAVRASARALMTAGSDRADAIAGLVRATDAADRIAQGLIARSASRTTLAAGGMVETEERAARSSVVLLMVFLLLFALVALITLRLVGHAERSRARQLAELEAFAGRVAHDLRDPLSPIDLTITLLQRDPTLGESARRYLDRQRAALGRVRDLIDALLAFARAGGPPTRDASSDVAPVLEEVAVTLAPTAERQEARLVTALPEGLAVRLPAAVLGAVVTNLAKNALLYLGDARQREVTLRARPAGASVVVIEVEDHGPGIAPGALDEIFAPFVRATTAGQGHGLGLATTKRLVEAYGGAIRVRSEVGRGSTFEVRLPGAAPGPAFRAREPAPSA